MSLFISFISGCLAGAVAHQQRSVRAWSQAGGESRRGELLAARMGDGSKSVLVCAFCVIVFSVFYRLQVEG